MCRGDELHLYYLTVILYEQAEGVIILINAIAINISAPPWTYSRLYLHIRVVLCRWEEKHK